MCWSLRFVVDRPPEETGLRSNGNGFSERLDESGAEVYLTDCVNANSITDTNLNISMGDVKGNQYARHDIYRLPQQELSLVTTSEISRIPFESLPK